MLLACARIFVTACRRLPAASVPKQTTTYANASMKDVPDWGLAPEIRLGIGMGIIYTLM